MGSEGSKVYGTLPGMSVLRSEIEVSCHVSGPFLQEERDDIAPSRHSLKEVSSDVLMILGSCVVEILLRPMT